MAGDLQGRFSRVQEKVWLGILGGVEKRSCLLPVSDLPDLLFQAVNPGAGAWKLRSSLAVRAAGLLCWSEDSQKTADSIPFGDESVQPPANQFSRE